MSPGRDGRRLAGRGRDRVDFGCVGQPKSTRRRPRATEVVELGCRSAIAVQAEAERVAGRVEEHAYVRARMVVHHT